MRHSKAGKTLSRDTANRMALYRNQTTDVLRHEKIVTTHAKAEEVRKFVDNMITLGKKGSVHHRRQAAAFLNSKEVLEKLFNELAPRYKERTGGYTRITKMGPRQGDGAQMSVLELV